MVHLLAVVFAQISFELWQIYIFWLVFTILLFFICIHCFYMKFLHHLYQYLGRTIASGSNPIHMLIMLFAWRNAIQTVHSNLKASSRDEKFIMSVVLLVSHIRILLFAAFIGQELIVLFNDECSVSVMVFRVFYLHRSHVTPNTRYEEKGMWKRNVKQNRM